MPNMYDRLLGVDDTARYAARLSLTAKSMIMATGRTSSSGLGVTTRAALTLRPTFAAGYLHYVVSIPSCVRMERRLSLRTAKVQILLTFSSCATPRRTWPSTADLRSFWLHLTRALRLLW